MWKTSRQVYHSLYTINNLVIPLMKFETIRHVKRTEVHCKNHPIKYPKCRKYTNLSSFSAMPVNTTFVRILICVAVPTAVYKDVTYPFRGILNHFKG